MSFRGTRHMAKQDDGTWDSDEGSPSLIDPIPGASGLGDFGGAPGTLRDRAWRTLLGPVHLRYGLLLRPRDPVEGQLRTVPGSEEAQDGHQRLRPEQSLARQTPCGANAGASDKGLKGPHSGAAQKALLNAFVTLAPRGSP